MKVAGLSLASHKSLAERPPETFGALPSLQQLAWGKLEYYNFLHFGINTFSDREWGNGDEDPSLFNPTAFDPDAICEALKNSGSKGVILTCKHHDGFCLWPTRTTEHSIRSSRYQSGKADIVKAISEAAARQGLRFGVYLSPWDRNSALYGSPQYIELYRKQMRELLTEYGPVFEIWHDGANGGSGYYGGANETRKIDKLHYYHWPETWALERSMQPEACRFSDIGPDIRWVGNEKGIAGDPCWATFTPRAKAGSPGVPGDIDEHENNTGTRFGEFWMPAECDVSIRPGWFWHEAENAKVKTCDELFDLYLNSVGRGASFLLNVPPDRRGLINESDKQSLQAFGNRLKMVFENNLASNGKRVTYARSSKLPTIVMVTLPERRTFDLIRLREDITLGQRVAAFEIKYAEGGGWSGFATGSSIGMCRILRSDKPVTSDRVQLEVTNTSAPVQLSEFSVFSTRS